MKQSGIDGVGVFASERLRKGQQVAEGIHADDYEKLVSWKELAKCDKTIKDKVMSFCVGTPIGFIPPENLDFNTLSTDWYMNHSCEGNIGFDESGDFVARRAIQKGVELTYDYGLAESNPNFRMPCKCGSKNCRRVITGNDWKDDKFRRENIRWMLPKLRNLS